MANTVIPSNISGKGNTARPPVALPVPAARVTPMPLAGEAIVMGDFTIEPLSTHAELTYEVDAIYYFLEGEGEVVLDRKRHRVTPGMHITIPAGVPHYTSNTSLSPIRFLYILSKRGFLTHFEAEPFTGTSNIIPS